MEPEVRAPRDDDELHATWLMLARAFGWDGGRFEQFKVGSPIDRVRCVFVRGHPVACARIREFGQFFGAKRVAMGGFSPVGVAADFRGRGFGSLVTSVHFADMRDRGEVLSGLYPATNVLYRKVGFEVAGLWASRKIRTRELQGVPAAPGVTTRLATEEDRGAIESCYERIALTSNGFLDRNQTWWDRLFSTDAQQIYVVDGADGAIDGYVRYKLEWAPNAHGATVNVAELMAADTDSWHALWRLVGSSSSIAPDTTIVGPHEHPLLLSLPEQDLDHVADWRWMARIVDAPGAIAARGYAPGTNAVVDLRVADPQCDWNDGRWRLTVDNGEGRLERGGDGDVECGIGALSSIYTGYASARTLRNAGRVRCTSDDALARLDGVFAGPMPWMPDFY